MSSAGYLILRLAGRFQSDWLVCMYRNDGRIESLGRGLAAVERFGEVALEVEQWPLAERSFRRVLASSDASADAMHGLIYSLAGQQREDEAGKLASYFVAHWPTDPRCEALRLWMSERAGEAK